MMEKVIAARYAAGQNVFTGYYDAPVMTAFSMNGGTSWPGGEANVFEQAGRAFLMEQHAKSHAPLPQCGIPARSARGAFGICDARMQNTDLTVLQCAVSWHLCCWPCALE